MDKTLRKNPYFRITFLVMMVVIFGIQSTSYGFNYFKVWTLRQHIKLSTNYVPDGSVDDVALGTVTSQIYQSNALYTKDALIARGLKLFQETQMLVGVSIFDFIKQSKNPEKTINLHLAHISKKLEEMDMIVQQLKDMASTMSTTSADCLERKKIGDKTFLEGVSSNNAKLVEQGIAQSITDAPCYITQRIQANAYTYLSQRIQGYKQALVYRKNILEQNKEAIIKHGSLLETQIDAELSALKQKLSNLKSYELQAIGQVGTATPTAGSLDDISSFMSYGLPDTNKKIPQLKIRFNDNNTNVPNFKDGGLKPPAASDIKDGTFQ